ncbi:MAG TPA: hypothetical protein PLO89_00020 [Spirochaetota bacterium]|nr:hypothetical protein [Spirochaetota bacterium]
MALNDLKLDNELMDISFSAGDIETLQNSRSVAQDLRVALFKSLFICLNDDRVSIEEIEQIIEDTILQDKRIDFDSVKINIYSTNNNLSFNILFNAIDSDNLESVSFGQNDI